MSHVASVGPAQRPAISLQETESALDIAALFRRLADAALLGLFGATHACVTLPGRGGTSTLVFSDDLALTMDCSSTNPVRARARKRQVELRSWFRTT